MDGKSDRDLWREGYLPGATDEAKLVSQCDVMMRVYLSQRLNENIVASVGAAPSAR